ncbi:P-loop containing nucleoside triphosphate hydrolase protein [Mrakia frigida]|uniref:Helz-like helicase n=1 Tax=Mrakia frigida TaxID=29902 RepID=UPI003FCC01EE
MFDSVVLTSKALEPDWIRRVDDSREKKELARRWLFPKQEDVSNEESERLGEPIEWVDEKLNEEQKTAVATIASKVSRVPYLISGPFGTGKTKSVVEGVLQILRCQPNATILLSAPSNSAADTLALRLRRTLRPADMLRLNDRERTFAEVPDVLLPYCYIESDHFALPPFAQLMSYRVVLCSCLDASILLQARASNEDLGLLEASTTGTIHRGVSIEPHWTHLLIDEAGQGSEPELLIPISVVLPYRGGDQPPKREPQLVLCGDPQQLGPIVTSEAARSGELDVSLLERLFEQPIYSSKSQVFPRPFTNLVKNYRCHPALLMTPSSLFYGDTLEPAARNGSISWTELPNNDLPFVFFNTVGDEEMVDEHASWYNESEGERVVKIIQSLLEESSACSPPLKPSDIGVMAPFREQVWRVRAKLRKVGLGSVDVGSVEARSLDYQGRESRITIVSTVRSRERFLDEDKLKGLGLVFEQKRFNVAITRAKELLIVVGNASLLSKDPYWGALLAFALRNKLFIGPSVEGLQPSNTYMSRLESSYLNNGDEEDEEDEAGAALSGAMAREALREEDN